MSSTNTSRTWSKPYGVFGRLWWVGLLLILVAVAVNSFIALGARLLFSVAPTFQPLQPQGFIPSTVIGVVGAIIVFALLVRWTRQPIRLFQRIAVSVLLVSLIPDLLLPFVGIYPGTTLPEVGALLLMHLATGFICLATLPRAQHKR
jgi:uncharacterized membrane protein YeaQ/YmgE (transglycosylase-associated protein family)